MNKGKIYGTHLSYLNSMVTLIHFFNKAAELPINWSRIHILTKDDFNQVKLDLSPKEKETIIHLNQLCT